jgi:hypothetical protein
MLISNPPVNSHQQLTNHLVSSNTLHSSLPSSFSTPLLIKTNPSRWSIKEVEEWLIKHDLNDCIDLICNKHHMNGQRLMNLKEDDVLQLKGTNKNSQLWSEIKKLQQFYSSNYHLWTQQSATFQHQQSLPITPSIYFPPSPLQTSIPLRLVQPSTQPSLPLLPFPPSSIPLTQSQTSSAHTTIQLNQNQQEQQNPPISSSTNQTQSSTPTTIILERSPLTTTRSTNNQRNSRRSSSYSLSTSNTSINILPSSSTQRPTNTLLNQHHHTPADQIEDQPMTGCCFAGLIRSDRKKTLSACLLALCTLYFCSFIITIVDERLPDPKKFPPLPDLVLDNVKQIPWAFSVTEKIMLIEVLTLITIIILHRHR